MLSDSGDSDRCEEVAMFIERHRAWVVTAAAVAPLLACLVLAAFRDSITAATAVLVLVLLVVGAASTGVRIAGIVAAASGAVWFDFFLTKPYETLAINDRNDVEAAVLLVLIGVAVTEVALWGHRQQAQREPAGRLPRRRARDSGDRHPPQRVSRRARRPRRRPDPADPRCRPVPVRSRSGPRRRVALARPPGPRVASRPPGRRRPGRAADRRQHRPRWSHART